MTTTNYTNTLILIAEDCPTETAVAPPHDPEKPTVAALQFARLHDHPYEMTSDDLLFGVHAERSGVPAKDLEEARKALASKPQPCLRASPLPKRYGWGIHHDADSNIALVAADSERYEELAGDPSVRTVRAMRTFRGRK